MTTVIKHFGVKGMHWGVRKQKQDLPVHKSYSMAQREQDYQDFGIKGVDRINTRLHQGQTHDQARHAEGKRRLYTGLALAGAAFVAHQMIQNGPILMNTVVASKTAARGASALPAIASTAAKLKYAKSRGGVFKITTL